jgi:Protein of unknown function (DUF3768)
MKTHRDKDKIRALNDSFRQTFIGGRVMKTDGVAALDEEVQLRLIAEVKTFNKFEKGNDPYGEHDFGSIKLEGATFFWKIDYFDWAMSQGSVDPANAEAAMRVLTIMCADEY